MLRGGGPEEIKMLEQGWNRGLDKYSTEDYLRLNVEGRGGHQKSDVRGWGLEKNFWPTPPPCHFKWNYPHDQ